MTVVSDRIVLVQLELPDDVLLACLSLYNISCGFSFVLRVQYKSFVIFKLGNPNSL